MNNDILHDAFLSNKKKAVLNAIFFILSITGLLIAIIDLINYGLVSKSLVQLIGTFIIFIISLDFFIRQNIPQSALAFGVFGITFLSYRYISYNTYLAPTVIWLTALAPSMAWVSDKKYAWITCVLSNLAILGCCTYIYLENGIPPQGPEQIYILSGVVIGSYLTLLITESQGLYLRYLEQKINYEKQELHQGQLASLGELAGNIAHEMNNPLQVIKGNASILRRKVEKLDSHTGSTQELLEDVNKASKYAQNIDRTVDRTKKLIDNLLQLARQPLNEAENTETSLTEIWNQAYPLIENRLREHNTSISFFNMEKKFYARPELMAQILMNLIRNSLYEIKDQENSWIRIEFRETYLDIVDSGPALGIEAQKKIMTPFYTTKEKNGTGLGLPLCASLMKQMGGDFEIPHQQEHATFRLILP